MDAPSEGNGNDGELEAHASGNDISVPSPTPPRRSSKRGSVLGERRKSMRSFSKQKSKRFSVACAQIEDIVEDERASNGSLDENGQPRAFGFMHDYLMRLRTRNAKQRAYNKAKKEEEEEEEEGDSIMKELLDVAHRVSLEERINEGYDWKPSDPSVQYFLDREKLNSELHDDVTAFWKAQQHPTAWQRESYHKIVDHIKVIVNHKRQMKCLKIEVAKWLFKDYMASQRGEKDENKEDRNARLQDFWVQMHGKHSDMAPPKGQNARKGFGKPKRGVACMPALRTNAGAVWKSRAAQSKCSYGSWDWGQGSKDAERSPRQQSPRSVPIDWWNEVESSTEGASTIDLPSLLSTPGRGVDVGAGFIGARRAGEAGEMAETLAAMRANAFEDMFQPRPYPDRSLLRWWQKDEKKEEPTSTLKPARSLLRQHREDVTLQKTKSLPSLSRPNTGNTSREFRTSDPLLGLAGSSSVGSMNGSSRSASFSGNSRPSLKSAEVATLQAYKSLPPIMSSPVVEPWQGLTPIHAHATQQSPAKSYLHACRKFEVVPTITPFMTGHSSKLEVNNLTLEDCDLQAITSMILAGAEVDEVDLSANTRLNDKTLVPFIDALMFDETTTALRSLKLARCTSASSKSIEAVARILSDPAGAQHLTSLDLSYIPISCKGHTPLARAIRTHPALRDVSLADTGLTGKPFTKQCMIDILNSRSLQTLDLSWNCFSAEVFTHIGETIVEVGKLQSLSVASCSSSERKGGITPVMYLIEQLCRNETLTYLDVASNQIDYRGALMMEDALQRHKKLKTISVAHNPMGVLGMRSFLRLLSRDKCGLLHFDCNGCFTGSPEDGQDELLSITNPGGRYSLDLSRPYNRTLLRMLYKAADRVNLFPQDAFFEVVASPGPWNHPQKDADGMYNIPSSGKLAFKFSIERALETAFKGVPDHDFEGFLRRHFSLLRMQPGFRKTIPILAEWNSLDGRALEQCVFIDALSKDFELTYPFIEMLCQSRSMIVGILERLLPCISGGTPAHYMSMMLTPSLHEFMALLNKSQAFYYFNADNPTGHYKLNLDLPMDYAVAERLILIDQWEMDVDRKLNRMDTSQKGNRSHARNEMYMEKPLPVQSITEWNMPEHDMLELDYSSGKRPKGDCLILADATFDAILLALSSSVCGALNQVESMRKVSHHMNLTSLQFRQLLGIYKDDEPRTELFIVFFFRIIDIWNEKIFRVRFEDPADVARMQDRLGYVTFFPYIQPEQAQIDFNFKHYDERLAANVFVQIAGKENRNNIRDPAYIYPDGSRDPLTLGVPRSWETFEKMPKSGVFKGRYVCSPEDRNFTTRKNLLEKFGFWECPVPESEVKWWAALTEAPEDVLEFLEFLSSRYKDVFEAFTIIDGPGGNGQITRQEFEEGLEEMQCHKFDEPKSEKRNRIVEIFRYLDPSGEGQVSEGEWAVLEQLWNEIQLSIKEFVSYLERTFPEGLVEAWENLDEDGGGTIDEEEWVASIQAIGYFGPTIPIFRYLDKDDEGDVSLDEFAALDAYATKRIDNFEAHARERQSVRERLSTLTIGDEGGSDGGEDI